MAQTISSYSGGFPYTLRFTLGSANVATQVTFPSVPYPVIVSIKPITNVANLGGANTGVADAGSLTTNYNSIPADRWSRVKLPPTIKDVAAPSILIASATGSTVIEMNVVADPEA